MDEVFVRPYLSSDQPGVRWLYERTPPAGRVYVRPQPVPAYLQHIENNFAAFWVAVEATPDGEAVIGTTAAEHVGDKTIGTPVPNFIDTSAPCVRLHDVRVAPERQRRGIGRLLVQAAVDWARERGHAAIILETTLEQEAALAFYRALSFEEIGRSQFQRWEQVWFELKL